MAAVPFRVKAVFDYSSGHEDDLPFNIGQIITVTDDEDADWYGGEYVDDSGAKREGIFPRNFVEKYEPTAPPRPTRVRKKETELAAAAEVTAAASPPLPSGAPPGLVEEPAENEATPVTSPRPSTAGSRQVPAVPVASPPETASVPAPVPFEPKIASPGSPRSGAAPASPPSAAQRFGPPAVAQPLPPPRAPTQIQPPAQTRTPPPVTAKPSTNSFRDRIAAFNKPAAPPVAPFKPGGLGSGSSGFVKKPFVAPPPSRNAYVPPPRDVPATKVYRRDEDPEIKETQAEAMENAERAGVAPAAGSEEQEDQPKPTSLKERIALLQKQQAEAAQRHADALAKKEKPKRPPKKRTESEATPEAGGPSEAGASPPPLERQDTAGSVSKKSLDEARPPRQSLSVRRKSGSGPVEDGNEADMSGAGDTTEGPEDLTEKEDSDERPKPTSRAPEPEVEEGEGEEEEEEEDIDPEVRRKQELRARMAKMSGGMGMAGMFGPPGMMPMGGAQSAKKPKPALPSERRSSEISERPSSPRPIAPPVPTMMALPGMGKQKQQEEAAAEPSVHDEPVGEEITPVATSEHINTVTEPPKSPPGGPPPIPSGRPAPPPIPTESRPPPPPPPAGVKSPSIGSESDDELSENPQKALGSATSEVPPTAPSAAVVAPSSPSATGNKRNSYGEGPPSSPPLSSPQSKRSSRPPPPIPSAAPPLPTQSRPPPPPPPGGVSSRPSTADERAPPPMRPGTLDNSEEGEVTEYEGDYDTDIASSVPHKDALKAHARESSFDSTSVRSPATEVPSFVPPRTPGTPAPPSGPPPVPSQPPPNSRPSADVPRAAPPPPPPAKEASYAYENDDYDPYNYNSLQSPTATAAHNVIMSEESTPVLESGSFHQAPPPPPPDRRGPPPAPPSAAKSTHPAFRQSFDFQRPSGVGRRSIDMTRPSMETGYMANDIDLASHTQWWRSPSTLPPVFQGRKDIHFEFDESTSTTADGRILVTKAVFILFQDYSQTVITVIFDLQDSSNTQLEQRHEIPPRTLRQDQLEEAYERFGRQIATAIASKKDTVIGDGTPHALVFELLRPLNGALVPVGTRAYGALVYSNLANAQIQLNDEIRPGDIISIRNAKFQGKHGPMHAKYSIEVGKPDHVAIVSEWDGTKKKVRAWEQGRESKKVKQESFKLDDLRSGEVKIWRVMPRSWVGWNSKD
ncbi:hypothetical protein F5X99DRAFT_373529 [Biscogniauxia marginata]|nr:hypothetical protein F5X99DRAFT_373529 [Biscogniauxia marginata]